MTDFRLFITQLSTRARWFFALGLCAIVGLAIAGSWWALHPGYAALASDLRPTDAAEIGTALSQWGIPYRFEDGDKTLLVPEEDVYATRMKLAAEGIPRGGSVGFESFKDSDYGVTEFAQRVNYQRALQGELERTIESMREVRSARVHLTIHHSDLFDQEQGGSKASVTLSLREGQKLAPRQVSGIQRLVASAVEELAPGSVTLLDQSGAVLSGAGDDLSVGAIGERMDEAAKLQVALRRHAEELLARALRRKDFTVSVAVRLNYDHVKRVGSHLLGQGKDGNGLLVREKTDSHRALGHASDGDPGTSISGREAEYAHGTEQEEVEQAPGRIERITVGIVVPAALSADDVARLDRVVAAGLGLDASRGDKVDLVAIAPRSPALTPPPTHPIASSPVASPPEATSERVPRVAPADYLLIASGAGGLAVIGIVAWSLLALRRRHRMRLSAPEREAALARIREWLELPEQTL